MVPFNAPHQPFHAPPSDLHTQSLPNTGPVLPPVDYYRAMVEAMETERGNLLSAISDLDQLAVTTIVFVGDNGSPGQVALAPFVSSRAKGTPYEGGINVPLIISGAGVHQPGREVDALVHSTDIFATVADLCGIDAAGSLPNVTLDSVSMAPYLASPTAPSQRTTLFSEWFDDQDAWHTVRDGSHKLIRFETKPPSLLLYNLENDPFESTNLLDSSLSPADAAHYAFLTQQLNSLLGS